MLVKRESVQQSMISCEETIDHGHIIVFGGAPQNPISIANFIVICLIENSRHIVASITSSIKKQQQTFGLRRLRTTAKAQLKHRQEKTHNNKIQNTDLKSTISKENQLRDFLREAIPMETEP